MASLLLACATVAEAQQRGNEGGPPPGGGGSPLADAIDTNRDGKLSADELKNAGLAFAKLDKNKDGELTEEEYRSGGGRRGNPGDAGPGPSYGNPVGDVGPNGPWGQADHNRDGQVTREEMRLFGTQMPHRDVDRLLMHFDAADRDKDGIITQPEIDAYGTKIGSQDPERDRREGPGGPGPSVDPNRMLSDSLKFDADGDVKLNKEELQKFIADFVGRKPGSGGPGPSGGKNRDAGRDGATPPNRRPN